MAAHDLLSLKERLHQLQAEQGASAVEGVHYNAFDRGEGTRKNAAALTAKRAAAVAPMTPNKPSTPSRASRPRAVTEAEVIEAADAAAKRDPSTPFAIEDAPRALTDGGSVSRELHAVQQEALNAEVRIACESGLQDWVQRIETLKQTLLSAVHDAPAAAGVSLASLKRYEDIYQCVHPIDDTGVMAAVEVELMLQLAEADLQHYLSDLPPLDRDAFIAALGDLSGAFRGPGAGMPPARRQQKLAVVTTIDEASNATVGAAAVRLYEDLYLDVLGPLREALAEGELSLADMRRRAEAAQSKAQAARQGAEGSPSADGKRQHPFSATLSAGELLSLAEKHQAEAATARMELVHDFSNRHSLVVEAKQTAEEHRNQSFADARVAKAIAVHMLDKFGATRASATHDADALRAKYDAVAQRMLAQHRQFLKEQSEAHNDIMTLQTEEQAAWAEVAVKLSQAVALSQNRKKCVLERMRAREEEARKQREAALEMSLMRKRQYRTEAVGRILDGLLDASRAFDSYVATLTKQLEERDVVKEHERIWEREALAAAEEYSAAVAVSHDLKARLESRASLLSRAIRQAELHLSLANETLDPDIKIYEAKVAENTAQAAQVELVSAQLMEEADAACQTASAFLESITQHGWKAADDDFEDPRYSAHQDGLHFQLGFQSHTKSLVESEQVVAEEQLTHIRHSRADADHAAKLHAMRFASQPAALPQGTADEAS